MRDPRFGTIDARKQNEDELDRLIGERCKDFTREDLVEKLIAGDLLTAPINDIGDVVIDPQIRHNQMIQTVAHEMLGSVDVTGVPIRFYSTPGSVRLAPPMLGQHTQEVLAELGFNEDEMGQLADEGIIGTRERILEARQR